MGRASSRRSEGCELTSPFPVGSEVFLLSIAGLKKQTELSFTHGIAMIAQTNDYNVV